MNSENKYYEPSIEEFHVGFECEVNWSKAYDYTFVPITLKICDDLGEGKRDCYCSNVDDVLIAYDDGYAEFRVKYLNSEDIESLGWNSTEYNYFGHPLYAIYHKPDNMADGYHVKVWKLALMQHNKVYLEYLQIGGFAGSAEIVNKLTITIKNKSELKKLMNQLNII